MECRLGHAHITRNMRRNLLYVLHLLSISYFQVVFDVVFCVYISYQNVPNGFPLIIGLAIIPTKLLGSTHKLFVFHSLGLEVENPQEKKTPRQNVAIQVRTWKYFQPR